jgi:hypothetical protein
MAYQADPSAVLDYTVDWAAWLATSETISASTWVVAAGITQTTPAPSFTTTTTTIWLTGGTVGTEYTITNHVTTNQGRQDDRSFTVVVASR